MIALARRTRRSDDAIATREEAIRKALEAIDRLFGKRDRATGDILQGERRWRHMAFTSEHLVPDQGDIARYSGFQRVSVGDDGSGHVVVCVPEPLRSSAYAARCAFSETPSSITAPIT